MDKLKYIFTFILLCFSLCCYSDSSDTINLMLDHELITLDVITQQNTLIENELVSLQLQNANLQLQKTDLEQQFLIKIIFVLIAFSIIILILLVNKIQMNNRLRESNNTKDKLFRIISHDLKSPIIQIKKLIETLNKRGKPDKEILELINESVTNLYNLFSQLLEWSNAKTNKLTFKPKPYNINNLIYETIDLFKLNDKNISINFNLSDISELHVDKVMFQSVIRNLISNAIKFTYEDGIIDINVINNPKSVIIQIIDNGMGISNENQKMLFTTNFTSIGTNDETGTGLGLNICKLFIEQYHKGKLWVDSEIDKGTTITIQLFK